MAFTNKHIGDTQSSLDKYIADRIKNSDGNFKPIDQTKQLVAPTHSHASTKTGTHSFREAIKPANFSVIKNIGTHSVLSESKPKPNGATPSHPAFHYTKQTLEFKTQSSTNHVLKMESGKITYNNTNLIKGTHSNNFIWATHSQNQSKISSTHSGVVFSSRISGNTASMINKANRFYAKVNTSTQKLDNKSFTQFISELSDDAETMIKTKKVTVNGIVITDTNYSLKPGDVVRVGGAGHYINNSKQTAIVK